MSRCAKILPFLALLGGFSAVVYGKDDAPPAHDYDLAILAQGIASAPGISPPDAPKDKYGKPYIIGDLGGQKVNLPALVVRFVEYDDSPGWDPEKIKRFRPPVRSYASILKAFSFYFRQHDGRLYDRADPSLYEQFKLQEWLPGNDWINVGVSGESKDYNTAYLDDLLYDRVDKSNAETLPSDYYEPNGETFFGLSVYLNPGVNPKTGHPWREGNSYTKDLFIAKDNDGHVTDMIYCSNRQVPTPPCTHYFVMPERYLIRLSLSYNRDMLPYWQAIAANTRRFLWSFVVQPQAKP